MAEAAGGTERKPRADSLRNRQRVLEAAKRVFSQGGTEAGLAAVAREAGVGIGTLYRHFPTREALYEAVYRREVDELALLAGQLAAEAKPMQGLRRLIEALLDFIATKKGMAMTLALSTHRPAELMVFSGARLNEAIGLLLHPAAQSGEVRADISPEDVLLSVIGLAYLQEGPGWQARAMRLVDVFLDGLRVRPG